MVLKSFQELSEKVLQESRKKRIVVAAAHDEHTLQAVIKAVKDDLVEAILVGNREIIYEILEKSGEDSTDYLIYHEADADAAAKKAVALIREGEGDFLMKGKMETAQLLRPVVNKEQGLGTDRVMSAFAIFETPGYHKLLSVNDGGMLTYPDLEQKKAIIQNTADTFCKLGYENPKIGVLTAIEKVNPKMPETVDAQKLCQMREKGEITGCELAGPISMDIALNAEAAQMKGYDSPVAGDADALVVPDIHTGNAVGKAITMLAGGKMAGVVVGAKVPVIINSRSASAEEKYDSILLACAIS